MANYKITFDGETATRDFVYSDITDTLDKFQNKDFDMSDIFQISLWKINRYPSISNNTLSKLNSLKALTELDDNRTTEVLNELLNSDGVGLPMASTYLRFRNPKVYQIIDVRAFRAAFDYNPEQSYVHIKKESQIKVYIDYIKQLKKIAKEGYHGAKVAFEDLDRFLYEVDKQAGHKIEDTPTYDENKIIESIRTLMQNK